LLTTQQALADFMKLAQTVVDKHASQAATRMTSTTCSVNRPDPGWHDADDLKWAVRRWAARMGVEARSIHVRPRATNWA
jgi:hypothetical protein